MPDDFDPDAARLEQLRRYRNRPERDLTLGFLKDQFKREVARPYQQLQQIIELWAKLVPAELAAHTRLDSLSRGVLRVSVSDSGRLYQLDRLLRTGLERQLIEQHKGPALRRVQLRIAAFEVGDDAALPAEPGRADGDKER